MVGQLSVNDFVSGRRVLTDQEVKDVAGRLVDCFADRHAAAQGLQQF